MFKNRETWHEVDDDEDLPIIAAQYGIKDWKLIYDHDKNAELRELRPNPHVLYKGDPVWIPEIEPEEFEAATDETHRFVLYPPKTVLQLYLKDNDGNPYSNIKYEIWINGQRHGEGEQKTKKDGLIFEMIPVVKEVELRVWFPVPKEEEIEDDEEIEEGDPDEADEEDVPVWWDDDEIPLPEEELEVNPEIYETIILRPAHLDPAHTVEGVQDRLRNLGYGCGDEHGTIGVQTEWAITEFQHDHGLPPTGKIDVTPGAGDLTLEKLMEIFSESETEEEAKTE
jgi:hypothetical protein